MALCIFTMGPTSASSGRGRTQTHKVQACAHTHTQRQRLAELDLQPATITCDWEPLKLVTNSILGLLIRHAWALGFLYVVIKGRVYGRPQALGWMIILTSSEPKATHGWGAMGCRRGHSHKISLWYTEGEDDAASGSDFCWVLLPLQLTPRKPHGWLTQREKMAITKLGTHTIWSLFMVWNAGILIPKPLSVIYKDKDKLYCPLWDICLRRQCHSKCSHNYIKT